MTTRDVELEPDAWQRFERAVDVAAKSPPQHRAKPDKPKGERKGRKSPGKRRTVKKAV